MSGPVGWLVGRWVVVWLGGGVGGSMRWWVGGSWVGGGVDGRIGWVDGQVGLMVGGWINPFLLESYLFGQVDSWENQE